MQKITKRVVDSMEAGARIWDSEVKGFCIRCRSSGSKTYCLKYRHNGRQRWFTIGRHGDQFTPDAARKEAKRLSGLVAQGQDPSAEKIKERQAAILKDFAERYIEEYAKIHKKTWKEDVSIFRRYINPKLGTVQIGKITRQDLYALHHSLRSKPTTANRTIALMSHVFTMAQRWEVIPDGINPCRHIKKFPEKKRKRYLSPEEIVKFGETLDQWDQQGENPYISNALRMLLLTGARLNEMLKLEWRFVDLKVGRIDLPDSKTGEKSIFLSDVAIKILQNLPRQEENPFVFCGQRKGTHLINLQKPWSEIRSRAGFEDVRMHDLRHTYASIAVSSGMSLPIIGSMLGHKQSVTTQRYAHLMDLPVKRAVNQTASAIEKLIT